MFDFLKKIFKGDDSKKSESKSPKQSSVPSNKSSKPAGKLKTKTPIKKTSSSQKNKSKLISSKTKPKSKNNEINTKDIAAETPEQQKTLSFSEKIKAVLKKTRDAISVNLLSLVSIKKIDQNFYDDLEMTLIAADVGYAASQQIIEELKKRVKQEGVEDSSELKQLLKIILTELLKELEKPLIQIKQTPFVILIVGVNGAGKTTTIGKLTKLLLDEGKTVLIAAGDTFRAAAKEQLQVWGDRNNVTVISQETGDPSAVIYDSMQSAKAKGIDIVIADTAGRLPTQKHLIDELTKIKKVIKKFDESAPHETILVLDANT